MDTVEFDIRSADAEQKISAFIEDAGFNPPRLNVFLDHHDKQLARYSTPLKTELCIKAKDGVSYVELLTETEDEHFVQTRKILHDAST